jgi:ribosomal protein S18 acetylase RimI-like enzyme
MEDLRTSVVVRRLDEATDLGHVEDLWRHALAPGWPLLPDGLVLIRNGLVAEKNGHLVGVVGLALDDGGDASFRFIAVAPEEQRQGVGRHLVTCALQNLHDRGIGHVTLGSGAGQYIWPGVPSDLPGALAFFDKLGWREEYVSTDLIADLSDVEVSTQVDAVTLTPGTMVEEPGPSALDEVVQFEDTFFPQWSCWFREPGNDVVTARTQDGAIVGSLLMAGPGRATMYWPMLGEDAGTIACVGVAPSHQGLGIGTAMVAAASRRLQARGVRICHIGWTVRVDFYRRLGYEPWRSYSMRSVTVRSDADPWSRSND